MKMNKLENCSASYFPMVSAKKILLISTQVMVYLSFENTLIFYKNNVIRTKVFILATNLITS